MVFTDKFHCFVFWSWESPFKKGSNRVPTFFYNAWIAKFNALFIIFARMKSQIKVKRREILSCQKHTREIKYQFRDVVIDG